MGNFAENLNLGNCFRPPLAYIKFLTLPSVGLTLAVGGINRASGVLLPRFMTQF